MRKTLNVGQPGLKLRQYLEHAIHIVFRAKTFGNLFRVFVGTTHKSNRSRGKHSGTGLHHHTNWTGHGWPIQARFWLEWGSSTAGQSFPPLVAFSSRPFRLDLDPSLTAGMKPQQHVPPLHRSLHCDDLNIPTQAKTGLEWATRPAVRSRLSIPPQTHFPSTHSFPEYNT